MIHQQRRQQSNWVVVVVLLLSQWLVGCESYGMMDPFVFPVQASGPFTVHSHDESGAYRVLQEGQMDCYDALIAADADFNREVNKTEYITFLQLYGPTGFLSDSVQSFDDLPL